MGVLGEIVTEEMIKSAVASFIATMSADDKEMARENAHKIDAFIKKFPSDMCIILYRDGNEAKAILPNFDNVQFTGKMPEAYNLSASINEAIDNL